MAITKKTNVRMQRRTGASGVTFESTRNKWRARISDNGSRYHLGYFAKKRDAVEAVSLARLNSDY
jgi:hypothetical protein